MRCATLPPQGIKSGREGGNPFFYPPVTQKLKRMSPAPLLWRPRPCVTWPGGFPLCQSGAVCGLCRASIVVGLSWIQGFAGAAAVTRSFLHVSRDLPVVRPLRFTVSPFSSRLPCASGCGFPCALVSPTDRPTGLDARHRPVSRNM